MTKNILIFLALLIGVTVISRIYFFKTLSWTVYTNKTYGYSLRFPSTYQIPPQSEKEISQLGIEKNIVVKRKSDPSGSSVIIIDVYLNNDGMPLKDYLDKNLKLFGITGPLVSYNFNSYDSLFNKNQPGINVYVERFHLVYHIVAPTASSDKEVGNIVSTFKFSQ